MLKATAAFKKSGKDAVTKRVGGKIEFPDLVGPSHLPGHTVGVKDLKREAERRQEGFNKELAKIKGSIDDALLGFDRAWEDEAVGTAGSSQAGSMVSDADGSELQFGSGGFSAVHPPGTASSVGVGRSLAATPSSVASIRGADGTVSGRQSPAGVTSAATGGA